MQWLKIQDFPRYSVSEAGDVRNDNTGRILAQPQNQSGVPIVGLMRDGTQYKRSVPLLVAELYLEPPSKENFNTPIQVDGDRTNCHADNLLWRPRWFAVKYHQQFVDEHQGFDVPIENLKTGEVFPNSWEAAIKYGLLETEIVNAILRSVWVFPIFHQFAIYEE